MYKSRVASEKFGLVAHILTALIGLTEVRKSLVNFDQVTSSLVGCKCDILFVLLLRSVMNLMFAGFCFDRGTIMFCLSVRGGGGMWALFVNSCEFLPF